MKWQETQVQKVFVVANKVRGPEDLRFIKDNVGGMEVIGTITFSQMVMEADMKGSSPYLFSQETVKEVKALKGKIERSLNLAS
jgi:CO dehydrogenase maturation factor